MNYLLAFGLINIIIVSLDYITMVFCTISYYILKLKYIQLCV